MKIAYISKIQLSDVDLSYLHEIQKLADVTAFMEITPRFQKGPAFNIARIYPKTGIFKLADAYPEYKKYEDFINIDKFYVVNTCGRLWQIKAFWTNFLLLLILIKNHFHTIHIAWSPNIYEFFIYALRKKMILTVHDPFPHTGLDTFIVRLRRKVAFTLIPKLIILNKAQRQEFIDFYRLNPSRVIDSQLSSYNYLECVEEATEKLPSRKYILFAGKISQYKGTDYLLPAILKVHESFTDHMLVMAGGGKYHFDITPYQNLDYIEFRNRFIPDEELVALMKHAEFVVCPYTDATQSGVIMTAFAFNKAVIATNVGGLPEMVQHGKFGLIVKEKDVDSLAEGICSLLSNPQLVERFSEKIAKNYGVGELSWRQIAQNLHEEYRKM